MSGEVRKLPAVQDRVETGPVQFGDDWPGVFVRGDNSMGYALSLSMVLDAIDNGLEPSPLDLFALRGLASILASASTLGDSPA